MFSDLRPSDVRDAANRIAAHIKHTPLVLSRKLSALAGGDVYLKCETEQTTGSFKLRGALNAIAALPITVAQRGIVASSAGNHGLGIAMAAATYGVDAVVFVPSIAPNVKKQGILRLGAKVVDSEPDYDAAMAAAKKFAQETGATFINPCLGDSLIAGQGTVALEILKDLPSVKTVLVPVGGGGLLGGISKIFRHENPDVRIIGAQAERSAAMSKSFAAGRVIEIAIERTLADGLAGQVDDDALEIGQFALDEIVTLTEDEIAKAIVWLSHHETRLVEGAGSVAAGALLHEKAHGVTFPAVAIISGGNIDSHVFDDLVSRYGNAI
jgi:threonine dehydratase